MNPGPEPEGFVDYYELLQISPHAEPETVQRVYRMLAARYHPDYVNTGDLARFLRLNEAYEILSDPQRRAAYDVDYQVKDAQPIGVFETKEFEIGIDGEENRRMGVLCLTYQRRRTNPERPGISILELEKLMSMPREHLMFSLWYLREKHFIRQDEASDFAVTAEGCDYVEKNLQSHRTLYRLLKAAESGSMYTTPGKPNDAPEE
jgi:curved DNA-binding protein CbpA